MTEHAFRTRVDIRPLPVPAHLDAPDAGPFREMVRLGNASAFRDAGHSGLDSTAEELLPRWQDDIDHEPVGLAAWDDGRLVGFASIDIPRQHGDPTIESELFLDPDRWGDGVEDALLEAVDDTARERGRSVIQTYTLHRPDQGGERLRPPTGFGSIPAGDRQTRVQLAHGYTLEQVERTSVLDLGHPLSGLDALQGAARAVAGDDYRLVSWSTVTPDEFKESFAYVRSRMSTDTPMADLVSVEETWDAARVERRDAMLAATGSTISVMCAVHAPTGVIAAYTELMLAGDPAGTAHQWGTLVLKEHRGRRLGMLVKTANIQRWKEIMPDSVRVITFNAEENRHMLGINEAMGFTPVSVAGAWKKVLA